MRGRLGFLSFGLFIFSLLLVGSGYGLAYDQHYTHPALTEEIAKLYNALGTEYSFSKQEIEWLRQGAIEEDEPARWINHFYDPVHKTGWSGKHFGSLSPEEGYKKAARLAPKDALPSIEWVVNQEYQASYGRQFGNQTWQKAINSYIKGNKQEAFVALGHVLHLVEDASVPDHTRDDSHPGIEGDPGSPYEETTKDYITSHQIVVADSLVKRKVNLPDFPTIQSVFDHIANYSNNNFFSEDTISNIEFSSPDLTTLKQIKKVLETGIVKKYLVQDQKYLALVKPTDPLTGRINYTTDDNYFVMPSYRAHLFPEDVLAGAGVIKLFFKEVEKYKKNLVTLPGTVPDTNIPLGQAIKEWPKREVIKTCEKIGDVCKNIANTTQQAVIKVKNNLVAIKTNAVAGAKEGWSVIKVTFGFGQSSPPRADQAPVQPVFVVHTTPVNVASTSPNLSSTPIGFVPSGAARPVSAPNPPRSKSIPVSAPTAGKVLGEKIIFDDPAPSQIAEVVSLPVETVKIVLPISSNSTPSYTFGGGQFIELPPRSGGSTSVGNTVLEPITVPLIITPLAEPTVSSTDSNHVDPDVSTSTDGNKVGPSTTTPTTNIDPPSVATSTSITDINPPSTTTSTPTTDVDPPSIPFLTITNQTSVTSTNIYISVTSTDISRPIYFDVQYRIATTALWVDLATSSVNTDFDLAGDRGANYWLRARATDGRGNISNWSDGEINATYVDLSREVIINEIAWAGTASNYPSDEWLELYNTTDYPIDIKNWKILVSGKQMSWSTFVTTTIQPRAFMLLERGRDGVVSDIAADIVYTLVGGFVNSGGKVELFKPSGEKVDEVDCANGWFAGDTIRYRTMEREYFAADGNNKNNWRSNEGIRVSGRSSNGEQLHGSPRQPNKGFLALNFRQEDSLRALTKDNNPYILQYYEIPVGFTLNIEPGVVVKSYYKDAKIDIYGTLTSTGTVFSDQIIFTSGRDASFIDSGLNTRVGSWTGDSPQPKDWQGFWFHPNARGDLRGIVMRYAGRDFRVNNYIYTGFVSQAIRSEQATVTLENSVVENSGGVAWRLEGATATITNVEFKGGDRAIDALDSEITITSSSIAQFTNSQASFYSKGRWPNIDNVTFANNAANPPLIEAVTLSKDTYVADGSVIALNNLVISASSTLTLGSGVELLLAASANLDVLGSLQADGRAEAPISIRPIVSTSLWGSIRFSNSSSSLKHVRISGGNRLTNLSIDLGGMIMAVSSTLAFDGCALTDSRAPGNIIYSKNSQVIIKDCLLGFNQKPSLSTTAVRTQGGSFMIKNSLFLNTTYGFYGLGSPLTTLTFDAVSSSFSGVDNLFEPKTWPVQIE